MSISCESVATIFIVNLKKPGPMSIGIFYKIDCNVVKESKAAGKLTPTVIHNDIQSTRTMNIIYIFSTNIRTVLSIPRKRLIWILYGCTASRS